MLPDDPNAPLLLADGTKIDPANGKVLRDKKYSTGMIEIPSASVAQEMVARTRRSINDLPVAPQQMNGLSLVCFYSMWGLADIDIALQCGVSLEQVRRIKKLPEYKKLHEDIFQGVMQTEATEVRGFMQQHARGAAAKIVDLIEEEGALGFAAAKDVLDRAGHRPADVVEHRHTMENALRIEVIRKDTNASELPAIDAEFVEIN